MFLVRLKRLRWVCVICGLLVFFVVEAFRFVFWLRHMGFFLWMRLCLQRRIMVGLCLWKVLVMVHRCVCEGEEAKKVGLFSGKELIKNYLFIFGRKKIFK